MRTPSGIEIEVVYDQPADPDKIGSPGEYPFTRGPHPTMYRGRLWTMRQYAGYGTADATNRRFRELLAAGQTGLSTAFDLPTQMGLDSDHPLAEGEVGKVGVAIDTLDDMRRLFREIPLSEVSTSMTINATAPILLLLYQLVAEEQGVDGKEIRGTVQNDILKEYVARGTYIYPPGPSMRIVTDVFSYAAKELPAFNPISISGYHIREAGSTAAQELAFTIAHGLAYVDAALKAGLDIDDFAPRLSFFWNSHNLFFEEVAKFRAARRLWADLMRNRFGAKDERSWAMRFHTQTAGSTLTAQQTGNNVVRTTVQAMAAILGGTQSLHTNSFDEAVGLPTDESARLALRTQQVLAHESGLADDSRSAGRLLLRRGAHQPARSLGPLTARRRSKGWGARWRQSRAGWTQRQIEEAAYEEARRQESGESIVLGVNRYVVGDEAEIPALRIDPELEREQKARLGQWKAERSATEVESALDAVTIAAGDGTNLLYPMKEALVAGATLGECSEAMRAVFGSHRP